MRRASSRKVDVRLPGKWDSNAHGARPVHLVIAMTEWTRTGRLSTKTLSLTWATKGAGRRGPRAVLSCLEVDTVA